MEVTNGTEIHFYSSELENKWCVPNSDMALSDCLVTTKNKICLYALFQTIMPLPKRDIRIHTHQSIRNCVTFKFIK